MARLFDDASSHYLQNTSGSPVSAYPFTISCWFNSDDATIDQTLVSLEQAADTTHRWEIVLRGTAVGDPIRFRCQAGGLPSNANTSTGFTAGTWHHACAVGRSATSR